MKFVELKIYVYLLIKRFEYLVESDSSVIKVRITSHCQLGEEEIQRISSKIYDQLSKRGDVQTEIDPSLLGGIKLRVGNTLIDSSVSRRLHKLRDALVQV